jgi:hypothetical protein
MTQQPSSSFQSFSEFWPYYVQEHSRPATRAWHWLATTLALLLLLAAAAFRQWWLLLAAPACGYALAWFSHFAFERNRPATFKHPLWSLRADLKMWYLLSTGQRVHAKKAQP